MSAYRTALYVSLKELNLSLFDVLTDAGDVERFISEREQMLGESIEQMEEVLLADHPAPENYLARVQHFNTLRQQAEEICLYEAIQTLCQATG